MKLQDLYEFDPNNPIDRELGRTANKASKDGSLDPDDIESMGDEGMGGPMDDPNQPAPGMDTPDGPDVPDPVDHTKPINSDLLSHVQTHQYASKYDHSNDRARTNPVNIIQMDAQDLKLFRNEVKALDARSTMTDRTGLYNDPDVTTTRDLLSFIDYVLGFKEKEAASGGNISADGKSKQRAPKVHDMSKDRK